MAASELIWMNEHGQSGDRSAPSPSSPAPGRTRQRPSGALSSELLERVRRRDQAALAGLFDVHFDRIYNLAYRLLGDRCAAEDASQDVFLNVYRAAHQLDPSRDPGPWLTAITYNVCREVWRSRAHKLTRMTRSLDQEPLLRDSLASSDGGPEADRNRHERERVLASALLELPADQRAIVILHDYRDMSHEEIAQVVGCSHAAVRKRYSRALALLRKMLEGRWP